MFQLSTDYQKAFFNLKKIEDKIDRERQRALSKAGAFVRTRQRSSIKRRKGASRPGNPPHYRSTNRFASPRNILFAYNDRTQSVAIGMVHLPSSRVRGRKPLPELLEEGGSWLSPAGSWIVGQDRNTRGQFTERRLIRAKSAKRIRTRARPSAVPALKKEIELGNVLSPWAGVITQ